MIRQLLARLTSILLHPMALLNPLYAFVVPFLLVTTIPLAVFAGITTTFAFSILILRVFVVYLDIALSLVSQSLSHLTESSAAKFHHPRRPSSSSPSSSSSVHSRTNSVSPSASSTLLKRQHNSRRRRLSSSVYSAGSATPASDIGLGLIPSVGAERDFEGVGGWRLGGGDDDDDDDDAWTTINSRLELHDRNHRRSLSGGPAAAAAADTGFLMMKGRARSPEQRLTPASPNSSKARAPSAPRLMGGSSQTDSYFPMITSSKAIKRSTN
ncbi:hypothetical protein BBK36DRAFT_1181122 [Trichoderma citrinoviride]|uniref:Uncharacterized protein n=1 Tax=Trichoderma citrinoviride TaxID=58853 RepID=A0A2T4B3S0_9HYPO|nr:hypothetical protein BBK36DRAFT_1181122 [Trichoderma citrinoviride]PTB63977.1 hypothetical protein BBK36DRAFT_1181122 [Trichoderma citrinoviride]